MVMPKEKGDVAPLLGQSVLQRFDFKYTQGSGRLVLTKVEPDEPARPAKNVTTPVQAGNSITPGQHDKAVARSLLPFCIVTGWFCVGQVSLPLAGSGRRRRLGG